MSTMVTAVVPARLDSSRFPGKVIHRYRGQPLIKYLLDDLRGSRQIDHLVVATDSPEVRAALADHDVEVVMTSRRHRTGSDRAAEVMRKIGGDIIVNIQGDNFGLNGRLLDRVISKMKRSGSIQYATLGRRLTDDDELFDPNVVKLVADKNDRVLWFSRYPLPYLQRAGRSQRVGQWPFIGHIGVYFFRRAALTRFASWKRTELEKAESLEQLRILENGGQIHLFKTRLRTISVDTRNDLKKLDDLYS